MSLLGKPGSQKLPDASYPGLLAARLPSLPLTFMMTRLLLSAIRSSRTASKKTHRALHISSARLVSSPVQPTSLYSFTEDELALRENVREYAKTVVAPRSRAMDEAELLEKPILDSLFQQGLMAIETPAEYGGCEASFTAAVLAIEGQIAIVVLFSTHMYLQN